MQIGDLLTSGIPHYGRAPDYDDWALNGDILVYYPILDIALELSSMGIRVDENSLAEQLKKSGCEDLGQNRPSRRLCWKKSCPTPSAAASVSPVSVCSTCARLISEKCSVLCGQNGQKKNGIKNGIQLL